MKLSDVMGRAGLASWAEVGLLLFVAAFIGIVIYTFLRRNQATFERARHMPLDEDDDAPRGPAAHGNETDGGRAR